MENEVTFCNAVADRYLIQPGIHTEICHFPSARLACWRSALSRPSPWSAKGREWHDFCQI